MGATVHLLLFILVRLTLSSANTYTVKIDTERHANVVDPRFLSFTIDPKYLFSSSDKYSSKECVCMASSLTPAYLRIAGPSTAHMTFHNTTISINDVEYHDVDYENPNFEITALDSDASEKVPSYLHKRNLAVSHGQWKRFVHWAKATGFDLVFALNNEERTSSGMWDPNTALNILTVAEKVKVGDIFWELGYECTNQSIEEYLNDLETLRVIIGTFPPGRTQEWKAVGGDITKCLQADSKSDFKDYLTLSNDMMDALLLNGNSSYHELKRMSEYEQMKLISLLTRSETPLWITETSSKNDNNLGRAVDWLASLGLSAKNGFAVHYRDLQEEEMYEPTLSFYMALLFKNLVGERVLKVQVEPEQSMFAHCTSLRHKPVPGAVTLFAANMHDEPARFLLKLSRMEDGGDIMQFILGNDHNGNIVVNGRPMYYEGNFKPTVKRVRPYKTLVINLPAKSFGFWVLANTKIDACHNTNNENKTFVETKNDNNEHNKVKRSINEDFDEYTHIADLSYDFEDSDTLTTGNSALKNRINDMNKDLNKIQNIFQKNKRKDRFKREDSEGFFRKSKLKTHGLRNILDREHDFNPRSIIDDLLEKARQRVSELKNFRSNMPRLNVNKKRKIDPRHHKIRSSKPPNDDNSMLENFRIQGKPKHVKKFTEKNDAFLKRVNRKTEKHTLKRPSPPLNQDQEKTTNDYDLSKTSNETPNALEAALSRTRRSINDDIQEISAENEVDLDGNNKAKLWKILKKMKELGDHSIEKVDSNPDSSEGIVLKTEVSDDSATIKVQDSNHGVIKSTMKSMLHVLEDLNKNLNKVWSAISLLD